jgi:hypothetical protein
VSSPIPPTPAQAAVYDQGRAHYETGGDTLACPYPPRTENRLLWLRGFVLARRDDLYGPPDE